MDGDAIESLKAALAVTPENDILRQHVADALLKAGRFAEAESEYKVLLERMFQPEKVKLGLAKAFYEQQKYSPALLVLEELFGQTSVGAKAYQLAARVLLKQNDSQQAFEYYQEALSIDPELKDEFLETSFKEINTSAYSSPDREKVPVEVAEEEIEATTEVARSAIDFDDVGGMDKLKEEIKMKIIHPLEHPEIYAAYGKKAGGGILFYGPPGCGKTYLARATAGEAKASFIAVGISDILDMWIGSSERNLSAVFGQARNNTPSVLFFDEVDALAARRSDMRKSGGRQLINQFLSEMDGIEHSNDGMLIMGATNAPWHLDPAFRRPGRFDRILFVPPPDEIARKAILRIMLKDKPVGQIDYDLIARKTKDYSGADLMAIIELAVEAKLTESMRTGGLHPIQTKDLINAMKNHRPTTKEWFATARNYALYSNEGGVYDDILIYLGIKKK